MGAGQRYIGQIGGLGFYLPRRNGRESLPETFPLRTCRVLQRWINGVESWVNAFNLEVGIQTAGTRQGKGAPPGKTPTPQMAARVPVPL